MDISPQPQPTPPEPELDIVENDLEPVEAPIELQAHADPARVDPPAGGRAGDEPALNWVARWRRPNTMVAVHLTELEAVVVKLCRRGGTIRLESAVCLPKVRLAAELRKLSPRIPVVMGSDDDAVQFQMGSYPPMSSRELETVLEREARALCPEGDVCWDFCSRLVWPQGSLRPGLRQRISSPMVGVPRRTPRKRTP